MQCEVSSVLKVMKSAIAVGLILSLGFQNAFAGAGAQQDKKLIKFQEEIAKLTGDEKKQAIVTLNDGIKLQGYVRQSDADGFTLVDAKTGTATIVSYSNVAKVKRMGTSRAVNIALAAAVVGGIMLILGAMALASED